MIVFDRTKNSFIHRWWFDIDKSIFYVTLLLVFVGFLLVMTASPYVANRIDISSYYFIKRQLIHIALFFIIMLLLSNVNYESFFVSVLFLFFVSVVCLTLVLIFGVSIKGAKRWIYFFGVSFQPSEFTKVLLPITTAIMMDFFKNESPIIRIIAICLPYSIITFLLLLQPDFGMVLLNTSVFFVQFLIMGVSFYWVGILLFLGALLIMFAYVSFSHISYRINSFLGDSVGYQITKAIEAFKSGGFSGTGPGKGIVKEVLPDAHTDFVFAVLGEEFGTIGIIIVLIIYSYLLYRISTHLFNSKNPMVIMALAGIITLIATQVIIHVGSNMSLLPTKGITLPLVSYGGSSMMGLGLCIGLLLALTKKSFYNKSNDIKPYKIHELIFKLITKK